MTRTSIAATGLLAMTLAAVVVPALPAEAQEARWFHVRVEEPGDTRVHISQRGDRVLIRTDEGDRSRVRMEMPSVVVEALLGTDSERLHLRDAVRELARTGSQDILEVQDGETTVRVWIGENAGSR